MGIEVKKLSDFLISNSIMDNSDEIQSITVDDRKKLVKFEGMSKKDEESDTKAIHFSATFDEIDEPVAFRSGRMKRITVLDEEVDDDKEVRNDKPSDDKKSEAEKSD